MSDSDFHNAKPFSSDAYCPGVVKPFPCEPAAAQGHSALLEPGLAEPFADPRAPALAPGPAALFGPAPLPPLLPPFPGDAAHFVLVSARHPRAGSRERQARASGLRTPGL